MDATELLELSRGDAMTAALFQQKSKGFWLGKDEVKHRQLSGASAMGALEAPNGEERLSLSLQRLLKAGASDAHMTLLLLLCPRLRCLEIDPPAQFGRSLLAALMRTALSEEYRTELLPRPTHDSEQDNFNYIASQVFGKPWPEQSLQRVSLSEHLEELTISGLEFPHPGLDFFKLLVALPSLHKLTVNELQGGYRNAIAHLDASKVCPKMEHLALTARALRTGEISAVIRSCPNLSALEVDWNIDSEGLVLDASGVLEAGPEWALQFGTIGRAITAYAPNLTSLILSTRGWPQHEAPSGDPY